MESYRVSKRLLLIGLSFAIILDTAGQLLWKFCVATMPSATGLWPTAEAMLRQPLFVVLAAIFFCQLSNWIKVLEHADLSFAQPITSMSYVTVCILSGVLFGEHIGLAKTAGVLCVITGAWLVSQGKPLAQDDSGIRK